MGMTRANAADWKAQPAGAEDACRVGEASAKYKAAASGYLPFGLKQTEVGIIPNDWEVKSMGAIGSLSKGRGLLKEDIRPNGSVPAVPYTALYTDFSEVLDYKRIKWFVDETEGTVVVDEPCVLIASSSNMAENTGKASAPPGHMPIAVGREVIIFRSGDSATFISYLLSTASYRKRTLALARGTTIKHLYPATFADYKLGLPALQEQRAIAEALSDVDGLLGALDALIAKKRAVKQAAMQQLLTGKTRLPGFSGAWETKRLGDLGKTYGGLSGKSKADFGSGAAKYVTFMNVIANTVVDAMTLEPVRVSPCEYQNLVRCGDLLFNGSSETPDEVALCSLVSTEFRDVYLNSFCFGFRPFEDAKVDGLFLTYYIRSNEGREIMKTLAQGSTRFNLSKKALLAAKVTLPTMSEQSAITAILADMDAEIAALTEKHEKARAIKQGMMQQLLTGRVRLVPPSAAAAEGATR